MLVVPGPRADEAFGPVRGAMMAAGLMAGGCAAVPDIDHPMNIFHQGVASV